MFCKSNKTNPNPNSMAEKTKKKKVKESTFKLSKIIPIKKTIAYNVIHNNSAVSNKCKEVFVLIKILKRIKKKNKNNIFKLSTIILK